MAATRPTPGDRDQDVIAALERRIGLKAALDLGVAAIDVVGQRRPIGNRRGARANDFLPRLKLFWGWGARFRFEAFAHHRQQPGIELVGLGELAETSANKRARNGLTIATA
jgi:hypothetical protein